MLALAIWSRLYHLDLGFKFIWLGIIVSMVLSIWAALLRTVERRWRFLYLWLATDCLIVNLYFGLLILGVVNPHNFFSLLKWSIPVFPFLISGAPLLHIIEERAIKAEGK